MVNHMWASTASGGTPRPSVHAPEVVLRAGVALLGGTAVPRDGPGGIRWHASALSVHAPEVALRRGGALLGRQGDVIVVWRLDRLGRNLRHLVNLVQDLNDRDIGIRVLAGQGASIDTTTVSGKLVFALFAALEEFERELIRERTLAGLASARAWGRKGGRPHALSKAQVRLAQAARHEGQRAMPRARRNQGDDLPLCSAR